MKITKLTLPLYLALGIALASCDKDDTDGTVTSTEPINPIPPTEDLLLTTVKVETIVIGTDFDPVTSALVRRLNTRAENFTSTSQAVIIDGTAIESLSSEQKKGIREIYNRGGSIVLSEPNVQVAYDFSKSLGEEPSFAPQHEQLNESHFCDVYIFNNHNDEYFMQDILDPNEASMVSQDENGEITTIPDGDASADDLTPYQYGLRADKLAEWINECSIPSHPIGQSASALQAITRSNTAVLATAQRIATDYYPSTHQNEKAKGHSGNYTIIYYIIPLYSFDQKADYYAVHQEIIGSNQPMKLDNWKEGNYTLYGFYLSQIECDHNIYQGNQEKVAGTTIEQTSPATTENASQQSVGMTFNIGGEIGLSSGGPSIGFNGGYSYSESYTINIPDVSIENRCKSKETKYDASWGYLVAKPNISRNFWGTLTGIGPAPKVSTETIDIHNTWLWVIPNPSGKYYMQCKNYIGYGFTKANNDKGIHYAGGTIYSKKITLNAPNRSKN